MSDASEHSAEPGTPNESPQPKPPNPSSPPATPKTPPPGKTPGANLISTDLAKQLAWFVLRLGVSYTLVAIAIEELSPLLEVLLARTARNLLGFMSSPYYVKTIDWLQEGFVVTTWIGPLQDGFKIPSLSFVFAFAIGYVFALPDPRRLDYWLRAAVVVAISFFAAALTVAIIADSRLTTVLAQLEIALVPEWRGATADFLAAYLWMLTVRLYPLMTVILLTYESGAFRKPRERDIVAQRIRQVALLGVGVLLVVSLGFDSFAQKRIERIEAEALSTRIETLGETTPNIGPGLVKLAEHLAKGPDTRGALRTYRYALDYLEGEEKRAAHAAYDELHAEFKEELLEDAKARRARQEPQGGLPRGRRAP